MKSVFQLNKSSILFLGALLLSSCGYFGAPQDIQGQTKGEPSDPDIPKDNQEPTDTESGSGPAADPITETPLAPNWDSIRTNIWGPKNCVKCHSSQGRAKFLLMTSYDEMRALVGKDFGNGELIDLRNPEESRLIRVLKGDDILMPPASQGLPPLTMNEIEIVVEWITNGMPASGNSIQ